MDEVHYIPNNWYKPELEQKGIKFKDSYDILYQKHLFKRKKRITLYTGYANMENAKIPIVTNF